MNPSLPFRPRPQTGESPLSLMRRGALGNHHHSTLRFAFALNPNVDHSVTALGTLARNPEHLRSTCNAMGVPETEIDQVAYTRSGRAREDDVVWNGMRVPLGDLQFRRSKICVACYVENGFASNEWDHIASVACAKHLVLLDEACPCCGTPWSPVSDPMACGCPPAEMMSRQERCGREVASALHRIIDRVDHAGLRVLSGLHATLQSWRMLGMQLSRAFVAKALWSMSAGRWPSAPDPKSEVPGVRIHPRVALAPLLTASSPICVSAAQGLLRLPAPHLAGATVGVVRWPASTAMAVLGVARVPFAKMVAAGHVGPGEDGRYSAADINTLLWLLQGVPDSGAAMKPLSVHRAGPDPESLASLVTKIKAGAVVHFHCPPESGLSGLVCSRPPHSAPVATAFGLKDAATRLGTNVSSVSGVIQVGLLPATKGTPRSAVEWNIAGEDLRCFDDTYIFASAIAKKHGASVTTLASRLRSAGLLPISGPNVDHGVTFVFLRSQLDRIDVHSMLAGPYQSPAGRKKNASRPSRAPMLTAQETADILGVSSRQLREVIRAGWITTCGTHGRRQMFDKAVVLELSQTLNKEYMLAPAAARHLGQSVAEFRRTWISTGTIRTHQFADRALIARTDFRAVQQMWQDNGTASSIGRSLNRTRSLCPNLEKMRQLQPGIILGSGTRTARLYPRNAELLKHYDQSTPRLATANGAIPRLSSEQGLFHETDPSKNW